MTIRCIVVDDHTLFRDGVRHLLENEPDLEVVAEASEAAEALEKVRQFRPDIVLMDIGMSGLSSFEAARIMQQNWPDTRVIFLTMYEDEDYLIQGLEAGAAGYMLKDTPAPKMIDALRRVHRGHRYIPDRMVKKIPAQPRDRQPAAGLTPREREIVKMIAEGNSVREVAQTLNLSVKTVDAHKFNLMRKLQIHNTAQLVTYAIQKKIVKMPIGA